MGCPTPPDGGSTSNNPGGGGGGAPPPPPTMAGGPDGAQPVANPDEADPGAAAGTYVVNEARLGEDLTEIDQPSSAEPRRRSRRATTSPSRERLSAATAAALSSSRWRLSCRRLRPTTVQPASRTSLTSAPLHSRRVSPDPSAWPCPSTTARSCSRFSTIATVTVAHPRERSSPSSTRWARSARRRISLG